MKEEIIRRVEQDSLFNDYLGYGKFFILYDIKDNILAIIYCYLPRKEYVAKILNNVANNSLSKQEIDKLVDTLSSNFSYIHDIVVNNCPTEFLDHIMSCVINEYGNVWTDSKYKNKELLNKFGFKEIYENIFILKGGTNDL